MNYYLISSQLGHGKVGGINTLSNLLITNFNITPHNYSGILRLVSFFIKNNNDKFIICGYSDKVVFATLLLFIFKPYNIIYIPCFHPWYSMRRRYLAYIYEKVLFRFYLKARYVICLSSFESDYFKKISKAVNAVTINLPVIKKHSVLINNNDKSEIIFVGRDDSNKNLDGYINLVFLLNKYNLYEFTVVSNCDRKFPHYIKHHKFLDNKNLESLYIKTKAIFITSKWESLSLVGIETILMGGKVVCNKNVMLGSLSFEYPSLILNDYSNITEVIDFLSCPPNSEELNKFKAYYSMNSFIIDFNKILEQSKAR